MNSQLFCMDIDRLSREAAGKITKACRPGDFAVTMGAGDVTKSSVLILKMLETAGAKGAAR